MVTACPNLVAGVIGNGGGAGLGAGAGGGYGAGCGIGSGLGMHSFAGGCKAACGSALGVGFLPLALVAAVGFLGYKVYTISKKAENDSVIKTTSPL